MKKGFGSGVGSGSRSNIQRYGSGSAPKCYGSPTLDKIRHAARDDVLIDEYGTFYILQSCDSGRINSKSGSSFLTPSGYVSGRINSKSGSSF